MVAAKEPDAEDGTIGRRFLARAKSNIGPGEGGFAYFLELASMPGRGDIVASVAVWGERIDGTAKEMLALAETTDANSEASALNEAKNFLLDLLKDGPKPALECKAAAAKAALSLAGADGISCRSKVVFTAFCSCAVSLPRLSVKVPAMRNSIVVQVICVFALAVIRSTNSSFLEW